MGLIPTGGSLPGTAAVHELGFDLNGRRTSAVSGNLSAEVPPEFARAVRLALRYLHETRRISQSVLLGSLVVYERAGEASLEQRILALRGLLCEHVEKLARSPRTEPSYRALLHSYLAPASTQILAAERAIMAYGTYRRYLASGLAEVAATLWLHEHALKQT